jgi:hypothetical protein
MAPGVYVQDGKRYLRVGRGCVLGTNVLPALLRYVDAPEWKDEVHDGLPNVGAVSTITVVADGNVKTTYFTTFSFERVFGNAGSSLSFYENREMIEYFKNLIVDPGAEKGGGARRMPRTYTKRNSCVTMVPQMSATAAAALAMVQHRLLYDAKSFDEVLICLHSASLLACFLLVRTPFTHVRGPRGNPKYTLTSFVVRGAGGVDGADGPRLRGHGPGDQVRPTGAGPGGGHAGGAPQNRPPRPPRRILRRCDRRRRPFTDEHRQQRFVGRGRRRRGRRRYQSHRGGKPWGEGLRFEDFLQEPLRRRRASEASSPGEDMRCVVSGGREA